MLFTSWRNESSDRVAFSIWKKVIIANKNKDYKHNGDMLDQAEQMAQNDLNETYDELAPGTQQTEMINKIKGNHESEMFVHFNAGRPV